MLQGSIPCYQCLHKKSQTQTILHLPPVYVLAHTKCLPRMLSTSELLQSINALTVFATFYLQI